MATVFAMHNTPIVIFRNLYGAATVMDYAYLSATYTEPFYDICSGSVGNRDHPGTEPRGVLKARLDICVFNGIEIAGIVFVVVIRYEVVDDDHIIYCMKKRCKAPGKDHPVCFKLPACGADQKEFPECEMNAVQRIVFFDFNERNSAYLKILPVVLVAQYYQPVIPHVSICRHAFYHVYGKVVYADALSGSFYKFKAVKDYAHIEKTPGCINFIMSIIADMQQKHSEW